MILRIIRDYLPGRREPHVSRDVLQERYALCGLATLGRTHRRRYVTVSGRSGATWSGIGCF